MLQTLRGKKGRHVKAQDSYLPSFPRVVESTVIVVGIVSVLSVVTLRQELAGAAGADAAPLLTVGNQHPGRFGLRLSRD
jgi:hypothetical protein